MIIIGILELIYSIVTSITAVVYPAIPQPVNSVLLYIFQLIDNGLDIVFTMFIDASLVSAMLTWIIDTQVVLLGVDLLWRLIDIIRLRRHAS